MCIFFGDLDLHCNGCQLSADSRRAEHTVKIRFLPLTLSNCLMNLVSHEHRTRAACCGVGRRECWLSPRKPTFHTTDALQNDSTA